MAGHRGASLADVARAAGVVPLEDARVLEHVPEHLARARADDVTGRV